MTPLYGHTDEANSYLVPDYPYGRFERCRIRYWIDYSPKHGYRFVSQTEHPDTKRWNKPKKRQYCELGACMYLDDVDHVQCRRVGQYSEVKDILEFVRDFPGADLREIRLWAPAKIIHLKSCLDGSRVFVINGQPIPWTEADNERHRAELSLCLEIQGELKKEAPSKP